MRATTTLRLPALLTTALLLPGCVLSAPTLDPIRRHVTADHPAVEPQLHLHLGRLSMALTRSIMRAAADDEVDDETAEVARLLGHVNGVEVAIYEIEDLSPQWTMRWNEEMLALGKRRGWRLAARISDDEGTGSVLYREKNDEIRSVYVFVAGDDSLVLARFRGNLTEAIAEASAAQGRRLPEAVADSAPGASPAGSS